MCFNIVDLMRVHKCDDDFSSCKYVYWFFLSSFGRLHWNSKVLLLREKERTPKKNAYLTYMPLFGWLNAIQCTLFFSLFIYFWVLANCEKHLIEARTFLIPFNLKDILTQYREEKQQNRHAEKKHRKWSLCIYYDAVKLKMKQEKKNKSLKICYKKPVHCASNEFSWKCFSVRDRSYVQRFVQNDERQRAGELKKNVKQQQWTTWIKSLRFDPTLWTVLSTQYAFRYI